MQFHDLDDLYREVILDHYRSPRGRDPLDRSDASNDGLNPVCGDEVHIEVAVKDGVVEKVSVTGRGCSISVASGSMMAETIEGKSFEDIRALLDGFRSMMQGDSAPDGLDLGDLDALEGVQKFPVRIKCALLPWMTLRDAIDAVEQGDAPPDHTTTEE